MKLGLQIPSFSYPGGDAEIPSVLDDVVAIVDRGDFDSLFVMDHYLQIPLPEPFPNDPTEPMMEGYTTLSYLAGQTNNIRLGTLVTGSIYRNAAFLIKQVTTLDVLSKGRSWFGIGAGWFEKEAKAYGFTFGNWTYRFERLEEILQIAKQMWSEDNGPYTGNQFQMEETICQPQPLTDPHPPIMIGGMGEKKTLRYVAEYADACNLFMGAGVDTINHKLEVLEKHCTDVGREFDEITKTMLGTINLIENKPEEVINEFGNYKDIGIDLVIVNMPNLHNLDALQTLNEEIIPAIAEF